jgi:hypothetical protein
MKKITASALACALALGFSSAAFAAPAYAEGSNEQLLNTVTGFSTGKSIELDLTQIAGKVEVSFDLGDNANYYSVDIDVKEGGKQLDAEYSKAKKAIILRPDINTKTVEPEEFAIDIEVLDRKSHDTVAEGFSINGTLVYDQMQYAEGGERYNNKNGVLYDFMDGEEDVEIRVSSDLSLNVPHGRGVYNLHMNDEGNESIDYMFSDHELEYFNFVAQPKFSSDVTVTLRAAEEDHLYEYLNGRLSKVKAEYDGREGYSFSTRQLGTYILSDMPMAEGLVDESINLVKPDGGSSSAGKDNPTTGASNLPSLLAASSLLSLAAAACRKLFR